MKLKSHVFFYIAFNGVQRFAFEISLKLLIIKTSGNNRRITYFGDVDKGLFGKLNFQCFFCKHLIQPYFAALNIVCVVQFAYQ